MQLSKSKTEIPKIHIGIMGDNKCGKTSLIKTFLSKSFINPKQKTIFTSQKAQISINKNVIDCIISEINLAEYQNDKMIKTIIKHIDVFFLCHELNDNDEKFNEEMIQRYISYISNVKDNKEYLIYVVGCKLDLKVNELKNKNAFIKDNVNKLTLFGQRIKTFINTVPVKKFYCTSALFNYNINELFYDAIVSFGYKEYQKYLKQGEIILTQTQFSESNVNDYCIIH